MSVQKGKARNYSLIDKSPDGRALSEYVRFKITKSDLTDADADTASHQSKFLDFIALRKGHHVFGVAMRVTPVDSDQFSNTVKAYTVRVGVGNNTPGNVTGIVTDSQEDQDAAAAARAAIPLSSLEHGLYIPIGKFISTSAATLSIQTITGFTAANSDDFDGLNCEVAVHMGLSHE